MHTNGRAHQSAQLLAPDIDPWTIISTARLMQDTLTLVAQLHDVDAVVAIARSGLLPGGVAATMLHCPLWAVSSQGLQSTGQGARLEAQTEPQHVLLLDDTVASGAQMRDLAPIVQRAWPHARLTRAAVYVRPTTTHTIDLGYARLDGAHFLEWNLANSIHDTQLIWDMDGIICEDCPIPDDDDGPRYLRFLQQTKARWLPRRRPITILTARHRKYEAQTRTWLDRHRVRVTTLLMRDWDLQVANFHGQVGEWKAKIYKRNALPMMLESDPIQARLISRHTHKLVLCPALGRVLHGGCE